MKNLIALFSALFSFGLVLPALAETAPAPAEQQTEAVAAAPVMTQESQNKLERARAIVADNAQEQENGEKTSGWHVAPVPANASATRTLQGLAFCIGIFLIGTYFFRRYGTRGKAGAPRRMRVIERLPLGTRSSLVLVAIDGKLIVASTGSESTSLLPLASNAAAKEDFSSTLDTIELLHEVGSH